MSKKAVNVNGSSHDKNVTAIKAFAEGMDVYTRSTYKSSLSNGLKDRSNDSLMSFAETAANRAFGREDQAFSENAGFMSNGAVNVLGKHSLIQSMKDEYKARCENVLLGSQSIGNQLTSVEPLQALHSVVLYPGVITPVYNKLLKTVVENKLFYDRMYDAPFLIDADGERYDYYGTLKDSDNLKKVFSGGNATATVTMPITSGNITNISGVPTGASSRANLIDSYNHGKTTPINGPRNFLNSGIKIVAIEYNGTTKHVTHTAMGGKTQSGQVNDEIATINLRLTDTADKTGTAKPILLVGSVFANGDIELLCTDPKVTSVTVKFTIPRIGNQRAATIGRMKVPLRFWIQEDKTLYTTIYDTFVDQATGLLGENIIELFNRDVIVLANNLKDDFVLNDWLPTHKQMMEQAVNTVKENFVNVDTVLNRYALFAKEKVEMNLLMNSPAVIGVTGRLQSHNDMLADAVFKTCNAIDREINPEEKNFVLFGSSQAAQWVSDYSGQNSTKLNFVADSGEGIAGIQTLFTLNRISINNMYSGWFVASNRTESPLVEVDAPAFGSGKKGITYSHKISIFLRAEEAKDSVIFLSGPERFVRGTGTPEFTNYESINYEFRYDIAVINKTVGEVELVEAPTSSK